MNNYFFNFNINTSTFYTQLFIILNAFLFLNACQQQNSSRPLAEDLAITWKLLNNDGERYSAAFVIVNQSDTSLSTSDWALYMNRLPRDVETTKSDLLEIRKINGDFFEIKPNASFVELAPGDSLTITYTSPFWATKESDAPCGLYFAFENGATLEIAKNYTILPFEEPNQFLRSKSDKVFPPTAESIYAANKTIETTKKEALPPFLPSPLQYKFKKDSITIDGNTAVVVLDPLLEKEAKYLLGRLKTMLGVAPQLVSSDTESDNKIILSITSKSIKGKKSSAYSLDIDSKKGVRIEGTDPAGVFYGIQSLLNLFPPQAFSSTLQTINIRGISVKDAPAFQYRGIHLDVSRNFHTKESVLELLEIMALYKLNKFHFHLTDDEGWRIEIAQLPELTSYGSKRGHTLDESAYLFPAYGSGPFNDTPGSGYYSREEFIEILKFADERHIEVIPEIDMPGHARAAIKAMEFRFNRLMEEGDATAASAFLLSDKEDTSSYSSVQGYTDNVICVCQESTYDFLEVVVNELVSMYKAAGIKLQTVHTGGDEVPHGAWEKSGPCNTFLANSEKYHEVSDLPAYFVERFNKILQKHGIITAGWEEIALKITHSANGESKEVNNDLVNQKLMPYAWNTVVGWGSEDQAYKLANAGFKVVMCNAPNLYFDFAYNGDPREPGYYWGGMVDTRQVYKLAPYNLFLTTEFDVMGNPVKAETLTDGRTFLTKEGEKNILGIQGQLWSETVKSQEMLNYYFFPKLLGLAQRAWEGQPKWLNDKKPAKQWEQFNKNFSVFCNQLSNQVLPVLDNINGGINYRIPTPGAIIEDGKLYASVEYPSLEIRYTTDGTEPTTASPIHTEPVSVGDNAKILLKAFNKKGRGSLSIGTNKDTMEEYLNSKK